MRIGAHSMLYSLTPFKFKQAMFREAKAMGCDMIRVDIDLPAIFTTYTERDFDTLNEYIHLSTQFRLPILGVITAIPWWLSNDASAPDSYKRGPRDFEQFGGIVKELAQHAKGHINHWELWNEPDGAWAFIGTPTQYGWMLVSAHTAIHSVDPNSKLLVGGMMGSMDHQSWAHAALSTDDAGSSFDVGNIHIRYPLGQIVRQMQSWKAFFARFGVHEIWVTEHGYPSEPKYQYDRRFKGIEGKTGRWMQSLFLRQSLPLLRKQNSFRTFVTLRDNFAGSRFGSEGILAGEVFDPILDQQTYNIVRKRAFGAIQSMSKV